VKAVRARLSLVSGAQKRRIQDDIANMILVVGPAIRSREDEILVPFESDASRCDKKDCHVILDSIGLRKHSLDSLRLAYCGLSNSIPGCCRPVSCCDDEQAKE
jgi:hypothetical protein